VWSNLCATTAYASSPCITWPTRRGQDLPRAFDERPDDVVRATVRRERAGPSSSTRSPSPLGPVGRPPTGTYRWRANAPPLHLRESSEDRPVRGRPHPSRSRGRRALRLSYGTDEDEDFSFFPAPSPMVRPPMRTVVVAVFLCCGTTNPRVTSRQHQWTGVGSRSRGRWGEGNDSTPMGKHLRELVRAQGGRSGQGNCAVPTTTGGCLPIHHVRNFHDAVAGPEGRSPSTTQCCT
jgi:hypothetical protein